jgi:glutaredoxin
MHGLLFTTATCAKCPAFKQYLAEKNPFEVTELSNTNAEFAAKITEHNVSAAPTLIVFNNETEVFRTSELSELDDFLQTR